MKMNKLSDFLGGIKVLEEVDSPINGKIAVVKSLSFGTSIQVGGLTQSGGIVTSIWNKTLRKVKNSKLKIKNCLVLGLGGGGIAGVIKEFWPEAEITAVDIDPVMVELGKKFLKLDNKNVKIVISDAFDFLTDHRPLNTDHFDLICIDLYLGDEFPKKFESKNFIRLVRSHLVKGGVCVFNRLYYGEKRKMSVKFGELLEKVFPKVDIYYPEANVMFVCRN